MAKIRKIRILRYWMIIALTFLAFHTVTFATTPELSAEIEETAAYLQKVTPEANVGSVGGEWQVIGRVQSGQALESDYFETYYKNVEAHVIACRGVLSTRKYTEYARLTMALTAIGKDPTKVAGYDLLTPLGNYEKTIWQGINGPVFALIALDSGNYDVPHNHMAETEATRQMYLEHILSFQLSDGGFAMSGKTADADITAMVLQALSNYQENIKIKETTDKAVTCLSRLQNGDGGFDNNGEASSESVSQAIIAISALGISLEDERFVKNGNTLLDCLMAYRMDNGGFKHLMTDNTPNLFSTEQAFNALVATNRLIKGEESLYSIADFSRDQLSAPRYTEDEAISGLLEHKIISGYSDGRFNPDNMMNRAEFATIIVKAMRFTPEKTNVFSDVSDTSWYASYVGAAYHNGIVSGKTQKLFDPKGTVTYQEAAVMITSAAKKCGLDTTVPSRQIEAILEQFTDGETVESWARSAISYCYKEGLLSHQKDEITPYQTITRGEIAMMVYNLLYHANLL